MIYILFGGILLVLFLIMYWIDEKDAKQRRADIQKLIKYSAEQEREND